MIPAAPSKQPSAFRLVFHHPYWPSASLLFGVLLGAAQAFGTAAQGAELPGGPTSLAPPAIPFAHAHNDYEHDIPLEDALSHGFVSVEADIYLVDGQLLVSHELADVRTERTLQALYLDPLLAKTRERGGRVLAREEPFYLMIDLKSDGPQTLAALREVLKAYKEMLTRYTSEKTVPGAVSIVLSGERPEAEWWKEDERLYALDGRPEDMQANKMGPQYIPWISDSYFNHFSYLGIGEMPEDELKRLKTFVERAHSQGRMVRFWATPSTQSLWKAFREAGVDLLNVDDLSGFESWAREEMKREEHSNATTPQ